MSESEEFTHLPYVFFGNDIQFDPKSKILTVMTVFFCLHPIYNKITKINMNKNRIRLTESQLHRVIKESVKKVLKEDLYHTYGVEFTPNEALRQFKINMYDYLDCPTIGGGFRLRNDMKSIKNHFPQINLIEIIKKYVILHLNYIQVMILYNLALYIQMNMKEFILLKLRK